jgi:hypothetical protein
MIGALVQLYSHDWHDEVEEPEPIFTGICMGWDSSDDGPIVLVDGKMETFATTWWRCVRVEDDNA